MEPLSLNPRLFSFLAGIAILLVLRTWAYRTKRQGSVLPADTGAGSESWNFWHLLLASFLTLFAELAFIRWIAVEVRVFAYFKNLALLLCFVGFGLGCALVRRPLRFSTAINALLGLVLVVRWPFASTLVWEGLSRTLGTATDVSIWGGGKTLNWFHFVIAALLAGSLFLLIILVFLPLGQIVSRQFDFAPRVLTAYSWNLAASLAGILVFSLISRVMLPPSLWLALVLLGFACLQTRRRDQVMMATLVIPLILFLHDPAGHHEKVIWTPYQQIDFNRYYRPDGALWKGEVWVNHTGYQTIVNLSPDFLQRYHPLREAAEDNPYNLPFRFAVPSPVVMIVGSGTGNDVAGALRHDSRRVDAVEIDPAILQLGRKEHPEHPYDSPRVSVHLNDARTFLKRTQLHYDLVIFGLLDSHTQFSDYSNMRIDNFVYTQESFREAARHLNGDGVMIVKFNISHPWMAVRLRELFQKTFGKPPVVFFADSSYATSATFFVGSPGSRVESALASDPELAAFVRAQTVAVDSTPVPVTTDDWPYLYQQGRWIPSTFYSIGLVVLILAGILYSQIGEIGRRPPSLFFFSMGAGFLLLETQAISRLALFFGTTWQINAIVISALLCALVLANTLVERTRTPLPRFAVLAALVLGLVAAYWMPVSRINPPALAGVVLIVCFAFLVALAGILFALEFRNAESPSAALGANMLGAVAGGLLENLSFIFGMRALLLVAMGLYCLAGVGLWWRSSKRSRVPAEAVEQSRMAAASQTSGSG